jgi:mRNA-degrading endonuclease RelE of RelBE toxin-antitoxin system
MFTVTYTKPFARHFKQLPVSTQNKIYDQIDLLVIDFRDSRLHTKKLKVAGDIYAFRVGRDYRVLFVFDSGTTIKLIDVKHRKDIYMKL